MKRTKKDIYHTLTLEKIVGGGQAMGTLEDGRKCFVWGGLPGENVTILQTKKKSSLVEGIVTEVHTASEDRVAARDPKSYLSTSPWQIMSDASEDHWKKQLVRDAFTLHNIELPDFELISDGNNYEYRNKVEFSFWWDNDTKLIDLAFYRRGTHGKIPVRGTSLARPEINQAARNIVETLRRLNIEARQLKTVIIRCTSTGSCVAQLYVKDENFALLPEDNLIALGIAGFELIYSFEKSPASVITKRLQSWGNITLEDRVLNVPFRYAAEGFFQVNLPVYELALKRMQQYVGTNETVDMYSGVGTIGLTIGGSKTTLVELNQSCVDEMKRNIIALKSDAVAVSSSSELALEYITSDKTLIVDPPRAGLHDDVVSKINEVQPPLVIYLSCNPVTQARDAEKLLQNYKIIDVAAYNFFPRTPHIENLIVLEKI